MKQEDHILTDIKKKFRIATWACRVLTDCNLSN